MNWAVAILWKGNPLEGEFRIFQVMNNSSFPFFLSFYLSTLSFVGSQLHDNLIFRGNITFRPIIANKKRSLSGNDQWASSSLVGTFSISYDLYAIATQRRLSAAISSIAFLNCDICAPGKLLSKSVKNKY